MDFSTIRFETPREGIGLVTLNRPQRLNAINLEMVGELSALFDHLETRDDIRVIILTGEGRGFCSGADLRDERVGKEASAVFSSAAEHLMTVQKKYAGLVTDMRRIAQPIIAAVNGPAAGGGMCLALASDVLLAGPQASFTPSFINIGLSAGEMGTSYLLPRMVGEARAADILLTGRTVDAKEAERIGLVSRLVEDERLMDEAMDVAKTMLEKSPVGLRLTKEVLDQNRNAPSLEVAIELENRNQSICCVNPDFFAAVQEFAKRKKS
jgi:enoyl-CoA hydratase